MYYTKNINNMGTFIKVRHKKRMIGDSEDTITWKLVIDSYEGLVEYIEATERVELENFLKTPSSKLLDHEYSIMSMKNYISELVAGRKGVSLLEGFVETLHRKYKVMLKYIQRGETILVNEVGGFSFKDNYYKIWDCETIAEHNDSGFVFPKGDSFSPLKNSKLILENSINEDRNILENYDLCGVEDVGVIDNLRNRDSNWLLKSISNSSDIYINTTGLDIDQFIHMKMAFEKHGITGKTFHLRISSVSSRKKIQELLKDEKNNKVIYY